MKAKEYYEKYRPLIYEVDGGIKYMLERGIEVTIPKTEEELNNVISGVLNDFMNDFYTIGKSRKVFRPYAVKGLIEEFNAKWNAMCSMFERDFGTTPFKRNSFRAFMINSRPQIKILYDMSKEDYQKMVANAQGG